MRSILAVVCLLGGAVPVSAAESPAGTDLLTGAATYEISVDSMKNGAAGTVSGRIFDSATRTCDGYRTDTKVDLVVTGPQGSIPVQSEMKTVETAGALEFDNRNAAAGKEVGRWVGKAVKDERGLTVSLSEPRTETFEVKGSVMFPVAMLRAVIAAAKQGETFAQYTVYDGTSDARSGRLETAAIGPGRTTTEAGDEADFATALGFQNLSHWPVRISYFPNDPAGDQTATTTMDLILYEDGAAQSSKLDFGPFRLGLKLVEFKPIPPEPCQ